MLGLDRGGSCRGVAFRIPAERARAELDIVWRREMVGPGYSPRWLRAHGAESSVLAIGFVVNRDGDRYIGDMDDREAAKRIATASGFLGPCADYLHQTSRHLADLGMPDSGLLRLEALVNDARDSR